ncbi:uncharacterized protein PHACADRAFT_107267, partial [Phanerochaete carnosa HHB-10118-sp]
FADTFEVYVRVIRAVNHRIYAVLGWNTPDWRPLHACRACCYKVKDEPPLRFSRIFCLDSNNSLKRVAAATLGGRTAADVRTFDDASYYLPRDFVDCFATEVRDTMSEQPATLPSDPVKAALAQKLLEQCVKNWKAAAGEEKKQMWRMFDESGLFASACRHGFILWITDMVRSRELAKYPLSIMRKILDTFEPDFAGAYDISCVFETTINNSSLGDDYRAKNGRMFVPAFHGYSHSHICQLQFHPNIIEGMGIEDAECLERVFSGSNKLAPIVRYASLFCRMLLIEEYFKQWDEEKYLNLGLFMPNNYVQALDTVEQETVALAQAAAEQGVTEELMQQWALEEREFFTTLGDELEYDIRAIAYVELLQQLRVLEPKMTRATMQFHAFEPSGSKAVYGHDVRRTNKLEAKRRHAIDQHYCITFELVQLEVAMGITQRWTPLDEPYKEALKYMRDRHYRRALEKLQKLVVQRLFELDKLNIAETGYKMRTHLAKSLQVRCKTIRRALDQYNTAAAAMNPPRPALDWDKISHYSFLEEFTLLQDTRNDICERAWAKPVIRESIKSYRRLNRAKEEITRLNCEVVRVHTAIQDEAILFKEALASLDNGNPLRGALAEFIVRRTKSNDHLLLRIRQIYALAGYTGKHGPGEALRNMNGDAAFSLLTALPTADGDTHNKHDDRDRALGVSDDESDSGDDTLGNDEAEEQMGALIQYIAELALL